MTQKRRWWKLTGVVVAVLALGVLVAACDDNGDDDGDDNGDGPTATQPLDGEPEATEEEHSEGAQLDIVGENVLFDTDTLEATAGEAFTVVFQNRDEGVPHDFTLFVDQDAFDNGDDPITATETEEGPIVQELEIDGLDAGDYFYICTVHPTTMTGTLTVQ